MAIPRYCCGAADQGFQHQTGVVGVFLRAGRGGEFFGPAGQRIKTGRRVDARLCHRRQVFGAEKPGCSAHSDGQNIMAKLLQGIDGLGRCPVSQRADIAACHGFGQGLPVLGGLAGGHALRPGQGIGRAPASGHQQGLQIIGIGRVACGFFGAALAFTQLRAFFLEPGQGQLKIGP